MEVFREPRRAVLKKGPVRKILLIGFRATGKSTLGELVARELGWSFVDLDEYVERRLGRSIRQVVEESGWEAFRQAEREALRDFLGNEEIVLALGGGAVLHTEEMEALSRESLVVWLVASPETILERLERDSRTWSQRPSLTGKPLEEEIREILTERTPLYARFADLRLDTETLSPAEMVRLIRRTVAEATTSIPDNAG